MNITNCPVCNLKTNKIGNTFLCRCGWSQSFNQKAYKKMQNKIVSGIIIAGILFIGSLAYIGTWGGSSFKVATLQIQQLTGHFDKSSFKELKQICFNLKKYDCVEQVYKSFFKSSNDLQILEELGEFQYNRDKLKEATKTYNLYFTKKGRSTKAAYLYGLILEQHGQFKHALNYYKYSLTMSKGITKFTAINSYINLLVQLKQFRKAKRALNLLKPFLKTKSMKTKNILVKQEYQRLKKQIVRKG